MKRTAIERLRKYGLENPEKAAFGTDDVSGSSMIGADSDNMFVLWRKGGGTELTVFTVKSRYNAIDNITGETLQVDHDTCSIGGDDRIETTEVIMNKKNYGDMTKGAANCAKPKYTAFPDEGDEDPLFNFNAPTNLDDDVTVGNAIAPNKQDHGIFDL
jgi:hypothetical protein